MTADGLVDLEHHDSVGLITLRRPDKLNALAGHMRQQLRDCIVEAARDGAIKALVIQGAGRAFCAGGDVETMARLHQDKRAAEFRGILHAGAECVLGLQAFPGVTVAALHGVAAGAGLSLALNCDLRVAAEGTRLVPSWGSVGLAPDWGASYWLPRMLGSSRALEWSLSAAPMDAAQALALGLVHEVVAQERLGSTADAMARKHIQDPELVAIVRALVHKGLTGGLEAALAAETEVQEERFESERVERLLREFMATRSKAKSAAESTR